MASLLLFAAVLALPSALIQGADPDPGSLAFSPVIGVLDQPLDDGGRTYVLSSGVSFLEMAGATVVPIHYQSPAQELLRAAPLRLCATEAMKSHFFRVLYQASEEADSCLNWTSSIQQVSVLSATTLDFVRL